MRHEPSVSLRGRAGRRIARVDVGGETSRRRQQRLCDRRPNTVERADRCVDGVGPRRQVRVTSFVALFRRRVLADVGGEVEVVDVQQRVASVLLEFAVDEARRRLRGCEHQFVEGVVFRRTGTERGETARTPLGERSCTRPSYSCSPAPFRASAAFRSQIARSLGFTPATVRR